MKRISKVIIVIFIVALIFNSNIVSANSLDFQTEEKQEFISSLVSELESFNQEFTIRYNGSKDDVKAMTSYVIDNYLVIKSVISRVRYSMLEYTGANTYTEVTYRPEFSLTKEQNDAANLRIDEILSSIIKPNMTTLEKVKAVNDYIVLNTKYDTAYSKYTHYNILFDGTAVCNGYALLTYKMLDKLGIPVHIVQGEATTNNGVSGLHAWNLVEIDGYWFNLDVTWNDPIPDRPGKVSYDYFLLTDEELAADHTPDNSVERPKTSISYNDFLALKANDVSVNVNAPSNSSTKVYTNEEKKSSDIGILINGKFVDFAAYDAEPVEPFIENGRTLVPLRAVFTEMGFEIGWDGATRTVTVKSSTSYIKIQIGSKIAIVNGVEKELDVPAKIVNGRTMVPIRFISESLGKIVEWDGENRVVIVK